MPERPSQSERPSPSERDARFIRAVRALGAPARSARGERPQPGDFAARLDYLERDLAEVRTRVNALFFTVLGAAALGLLGRAALS
jgi:hypothetical protein